MSDPFEEENFEEIAAKLEVIAKQPGRRDDCSALCVKLKKHKE